MTAWLRLPRSANPNQQSPLKGYSSLEHLQKELFDQHKRNHPPAEFDPAWLIEPTICNFTPNGVQLYKWSNARQMWVLDAEITWSY